jgi:hypothetical protein
MWLFDMAGFMRNSPAALQIKNESVAVQKLIQETKGTKRLNSTALILLYQRPHSYPRYRMKMRHNHAKARFKSCHSMAPYQAGTIPKVFAVHLRRFNSALRGCESGGARSATVARHASAAFRAFAAGPGARFHPIQFFATFRTGIANFGADPADVIAQPGAAQHEVKRRLTDFGTVDHEPEMFRLHMLSA